MFSVLPRTAPGRRMKGGRLGEDSGGKVKYILAETSICYEFLVHDIFGRVCSQRKYDCKGLQSKGKGVQDEGGPCANPSTRNAHRNNSNHHRLKTAFIQETWSSLLPSAVMKKIIMLESWSFRLTNQLLRHTAAVTVHPGPVTAEPHGRNQIFKSDPSKTNLLLVMGTIVNDLHHQTS